VNREKTLSRLAVFLIRLHFSTLRLRFDDHIGFTTGRYRKPVIMCFWHNRILGITLCHMRKYPHGKRPGVTVLTSPSKDGEIIAGVAQGFGMGSVRGSSSRRGSTALRELVSLVESGGDIAVTPDGPRGPRYVLGPGAILLAQTTGAVLAPVHARYSRCFRMKTWDGFIIPWPFSTVTVTVDEMIPVPRDLTEEQFEATRLRLENQLKADTEQ
jgi:lysophospholipid acyltransferase (LPLAT)-like uncharacterized protein